MKKLHISLLAIICAFVGTANADDVNVPGWGSYTDVASAWGGTANYTSSGSEEIITTGLCTSTTSSDCADKEPQVCGSVDEDNCVYEYEETMTVQNYKLKLATDTLFRQVLNEIEKDAQAQYNAKLTLEQNMCRNANSGGIMGRNDMASTYMWVKLKSRRVPKNYSVNGLKENEFDKSNDLYGSFCRARVTVQSDDPAIQRYIQEKNNTKNWTTAYFAVGDVFTCGSWISQEDLEKIAEQVAAKKLGKTIADAKDGTMSTAQQWAVAASTIGSVALGGVGMDLLQSRTGLGGFLSTDKGINENENKINNNIIAAESIWSLGCSGAGNTGVVVDNANAGTVGGYTLKTWKIKSDGAAREGCNDLRSYISTMETAKTNVGKEWTGGRRLADGLAAAAVGTAGLLATRSNIKAANRQQFTAAQQEFMDNVGNHIYCFIGADEAGTYGDLIEISLD